MVKERKKNQYPAVPFAMGTEYLKAHIHSFSCCFS